MRRNRHERAGFQLYGRAVAAARDPWFYDRLAVPDTLDGRFDMVCLYAGLLIRRLGALPPPGPVLSQAVFDAMFADMDLNLREMGVGDLSVGKKVRAMWEGLHGRALAYGAALSTGDRAALAAALARNVWRGAAPAGAADTLAGIALAEDRHLAGQGVAVFAGGTVEFLPAAGAVAA
jgi:cytochrome b pre-mRNA-processing protein 3